MRNILLSVFITNLCASAVGQSSTRVESKFRILAPEFICPKDENAVVEKPDNTIITLQVASDADVRIEWTVRWRQLVPAPTQRFTLMLWRTVRALEKQLNKPPPEPYVYIIENSELLPGVNYIFNISSIESTGEVSDPRSFNIDNTQGDQKLMIEGRNDMLSVMLVGAQVAYVDAMFVVDAEITTCTPTQDYYFVWKVQSLESNDFVDVSPIQGSRLEVPPCTLKVGLIYNVICQVMRYNTGDLITQTNLPFSVQHKGLEVHLNVDNLLISINIPFTLEAIVDIHDYCKTSPVTYEWDCSYKAESCNDITVVENDSLSFPSGIANPGEYLITVTVKVSNQNAVANATLMVLDAILPAIHVNPVSRLVNEGYVISVEANATNLAPTCTLSWYFATEAYLASLNSVVANDTCVDCKHGEALSETVTIHSLEEQFLSELADFSNETEWRQVEARLPAAEGRARFVAECGCSLTFSCNTLGTVHADVWFKVNEGPKAKDIMVSPETGTALETVFRLSTLAAIDPDAPLRYSFYCTVGNDTILLGSYVEHRALETLLPFSAEGTEVYVEVCDHLGACTKSNSKVVTLSPGEGRTVDELEMAASAHARRCELVQLTQVVQSAFVTYTTTRKPDLLTKFIESLQKALANMDKNNCVLKYYSKYSELLFWLANNGIEANDILNGS